MLRSTSILLVLSFLVGLMETYSLLDKLGGAYDLKLDHIDHCDKRGKYDLLSNMRVGKLNRTHLVYSGRFDSRVDLDDKVKLRVVAQLRGPSGHYSSVIVLKNKACDLIKTFGMEIVESISDHCNQTFECPMKRLNCEMKDWVVNYNFNNIPALPYGDYRVDGSLIKMIHSQEELLICLRLYGSARPKYGRKKRNIHSNEQLKNSTV